MELLGSNIKKFQETETPKKFFIFQETETLRKASYLSGNGTFQSALRKFLIFQATKTLKKFRIYS